MPQQPSEPGVQPDVLASETTNITRVSDRALSCLATHWFQRIHLPLKVRTRSMRAGGGKELERIRATPTGIYWS